MKILTTGETVADAVQFLLADEKERVLLTSMVACLFSRGVYSRELLGKCLHSVGYTELANNMEKVAGEIRQLRLRMRLATGFRLEEVTIHKRFSEITTRRGAVERQTLETLKSAYARSILDLAAGDG